jgi:kinesin family protein 6/9
MESSSIDIFLRVRPVARPSPRVALDLAEQRVAFSIPRDAEAG